jgi:hypothetical protein
MTDKPVTTPSRLFKSDMAQVAWDHGASHFAIQCEMIYDLQMAFRKVKKWLTRQ